MIKYTNRYQEMGKGIKNLLKCEMPVFLHKHIITFILLFHPFYVKSSNFKNMHSYVKIHPSKLVEKNLKRRAHNLQTNNSPVNLTDNLLPENINEFPF